MNRRLLSSSLFGAYLAVRSGECAKLAFAWWWVTGQLVVAATVALVFAGAVYLVAEGIYRKRTDSAAIWHWLIELFLIPLSVMIAWDAALLTGGPDSPFTSLPFGLKWGFYTMALLMVQITLSLFGHEIVVRVAGR